MFECPKCEGELEYHDSYVEETESAIEVTYKCSDCDALVTAKGMFTDYEVE